ncbi:SET domain-containing protein-lysine N-methyltransferase [Streptomyces sp. UNOB3_S3]|uniref:SET domain-containing protein-lysine N-methyltransferase n=1 Tax=Streptomyces sp. UNOB3_S3 TaxID=2871682 RepID=UPI001E314B25|nr:SET domain-containing protein [Streptomyces sp. UNOB3_S3]MCC3775416.1 SET domain-containing protein-lysine N-methyltransferase [Streptomyces sp. UNOB3_S3]
MSTDVLRVVHDRRAGAGVVAARALAQGETVCDLGACTVMGEASVHTIDMGGGRHIDVPRVRYLNHSCAPNAYVDTRRTRLAALCAIGAGEELTLFYPATEWEMMGPFACLCGTDTCIGTVSGARHTPAEILRRHVLSDHIVALSGISGAMTG